MVTVSKPGAQAGPGLSEPQRSSGGRRPGRRGGEDRGARVSGLNPQRRWPLAAPGGRGDRRRRGSRGSRGGAVAALRSCGAAVAEAGCSRGGAASHERAEPVAEAASVA